MPSTQLIRPKPETQGGWNASVAAGKDKPTQLEWYKEVPEKYRKGVAVHMRMVSKMKELT